MKETKERKPKYFITYRCLLCNLLFFHDELEKPECQFCGETKKVFLVQKEKYCVEILDKKMVVLAEQSLSNSKRWFLEGNFAEGYSEDDELKWMKELNGRIKAVKNGTVPLKQARKLLDKETP